jgi:hypothetical protein
MIGFLLWAASAAAQAPLPDTPQTALDALARRGRSAAAPCPADAGTGDIVVCGRDRAAARYRLPLPSADDTGSSARADVSQRIGTMREGRSGIGSCTASGPGGSSGCSKQEWKRISGRE